MGSNAAVLAELNRRRDSLSPKQQKILDELTRRQGQSPDRSWMDDAGDYLKGVWSQVNPAVAVQGISDLAQTAGKATAQHPWAGPLAGIGAIAGQIGAAQDVPRQRAEEAFKKGNYAEGLRHSLGYLIPLLGPAIDEAGNKAQSGDVASGLGEATGIGLNAVAPKYVPKLVEGVKATTTGAIRKALPNLNNPVEEAALASVEDGVPMTVGQRTGNTGLQRVEQGLQNFPGSANRSQKFYANQEDALAQKAQDLANSAGGQSTNAVGAGEALQQRLAQRISRLKQYADENYNAVRSAAAKNQVPVQIGMQDSPLVAPNGTPIQTPIVTMGESPVSLGPIRQALMPVYDDLMASMPEARRAASPAFAALKNLMESDAPTMNAMDFDRSLSAIKALGREGPNPYLTSKSQGIAKQIVSNGEKQLQDALSKAGPDVLDKLGDARKAVKSYHETAEMLADLPGEPAALYSSLTTGGDRAYNTLQTLKRVAPNEVKTVGRTYLQGLVDKATAEGGFGRSKGVMADWKRLGPEAKDLMFGPKLTQNLDDFFLAAKRLTVDVNPSGSAHTIAALHGLGALGTAIGSLFVGNLPLAAGIATGAVGEAFIGSHLAARFLFNPDNARLLAKALSTPTGTPQFSRLAALLNARYAAVSQDQAH